MYRDRRRRHLRPPREGAGYCLHKLEKKDLLLDQIILNF